MRHLFTLGWLTCCMHARATRTGSAGDSRQSVTHARPHSFCLGNLGQVLHCDRYQHSGRASKLPVRGASRCLVLFFFSHLLGRPLRCFIVAVSGDSWHPHLPPNSTDIQERRRLPAQVGLLLPPSCILFELYSHRPLALTIQL